MPGPLDEIVHIGEERSWLTGRITSLCGITWDGGDYYTVWFAPFLPRCQECKRIAAKH